MAIKQDEKLEVVNKFHVTGKSKALGLLLAELESSIRGKAVHERDETRQDVRAGLRREVRGNQH